MDQDEILLDAEDRMEKAVEHLTTSLSGIRTGRATPGLVDSVRVDYYGSPTPLKQIANVSVPEPQQLMIRPFDTSSLDGIVKAIQGSDLGLAPNNDGRVIRLNIPPLSGDRRKQLVGRIKELAEEARVSIRNIRRDANKPRPVQGQGPGTHQKVRRSGEQQSRIKRERNSRSVAELLFRLSGRTDLIRPLAAFAGQWQFDLKHGAPED